MFSFCQKLAKCKGSERKLDKVEQSYSSPEKSASYEAVAVLAIGAKAHQNIHWSVSTPAIIDTDIAPSPRGRVT